MKELILIPTILLTLTVLSRGDTNTATHVTAETQVVEKAESTFDIEFMDVADHLVLIESEHAGEEVKHCGFVALMDGKPYLITSQSFMLGTERLAFTSLTGRPIKPRSIEISAGRDLIRMALTEGGGLHINNDFSMNDPIAVFGSSELHSGTNALFGAINGVGADIFEVSAEFEEDHSGAPVVNKHGDVIGLASYAVKSRGHAMKKGTRFENNKRRFCLRLTQTDWHPVNWKKYNQKFGAAYRSNAIFIDDIIAILNSWADGPLDQVDHTSKSGTTLSRWMDSHNTVVGHEVGTGSARRDFYMNYSESTAKLSSLCRTHARELYLLSEQRGLTDFMINELEMQASSLEYFANIIDQYGASTYRTDD